jgi:hypothetical protein
MLKCRIINAFSVELQTKSVHFVSCAHSTFFIFHGGRGDIGDHIQTKAGTAAIQAASSITELLLFFKQRSAGVQPQKANSKPLRQTHVLPP